MSTGTPRRRPRVLLLMTGSVAVQYRAIELADALCAREFDVAVAASEAAMSFLRLREDWNSAAIPCHPPSLHATQRPPPLNSLERWDHGVWSDNDEWSLWTGRDSPVLHIHLRKWADVLLFAPLTAHSLAKLALGLADNLISCVARAWDSPISRIVLAPAMNSAMWQHTVTKRHLDVLTDQGARLVPPVEKLLACGDVGVGGFAPIELIVEAVEQALDH